MVGRERAGSRSRGAGRGRLGARLKDLLGRGGRSCHRQVGFERRKRGGRAVGLLVFVVGEAVLVSSKL
jgi:hypothetical protein